MTNTMPQTAEHGSANAALYPSIQTVLLEGKNRWGNLLQLSRHSKGYEVAGSAMRWTNDRYSVLFYQNGVTYGQSYKNLEQAQARFNAIKA